MHIPYIWPNGNRLWYKHKFNHKIDITIAKADIFFTEYHKIGILHRINGPAISYTNGNKEYLQFGKRHRVDGPALQWSDHKEYWEFGELHRIDGPAIQDIDYTEYWEHGKKIS